MQFLNILSWVMISLAGLYVLWVVFCALYGILMQTKTFPSVDDRLRFAVITCARNEENVIGNLIESLKKQHYPKEKYDIFVVAHNCQDRTAEIAEGCDAKVLIRNCPEEKRKGDAMRFGLQEIRKNAVVPYDAFVVFDADNIAGTEFLTEINKALCSGADVVQGFRATKNFDDNLLTRLFGTLWMAMIYAQNLPHTALHLPATISGTGFAALFSALPEDGWRTETLCEDIEFTVQQVLRGHRVICTVQARFYDEQPKSLKAALQQRFRWAVGINQCFTHYGSKTLRAIPKYGASAFKMLLDIAMNPVLILGVLGIAAQVVFRLMSGNSLLSVLVFLGILSAGGWLVILPFTLNVLVREKQSFFENLGVVILFPFFLFFSGLLALIAPFCGSASWKPIPHGSDKKLEDLEK